jgi:hypothetical protein
LLTETVIRDAPRTRPHYDDLDPLVDDIGTNDVPVVGGKNTPLGEMWRP